jgi:tRNA (adenine57-N1/adenine58-N1)-methyltransferase
MIEVFEAGTGHGALTLNLARAIHGANTAAPPLPATPSTDTNERSSEALNEGPNNKGTKAAYDIWRYSRRAVIHTLDQNATFSAHAQKTVRNFRRGMYFPNIDFHVGSINEYLSGRLSHTDGAPMFDHAILDLPNTHHYLAIVGQALKANGSLVTWCPSITQINSCVTMVREETMPFVLEKVIEVGQGLSGGREWDVKMVRPRATMKLEPRIQAADGQASEAGSESEEKIESPSKPVAEDEGWEMVCRPKVGVKIIGGGFIALWRKMQR